VAKTSTRTTVFDASPETLLEVLTSAAFQEKQRRIDEAVVDAKFVEISRTEDRLEYELRSTEYERGMTGLNKKKTIKSVTRVTWDLRARKGTWTYSTPAYDRFKLSGAHAIEASGDRARYVAGFTVEVKVPLLGGKIEGMIAEGMTKGSERWDALLREFLAKAK
jgi:hypothetical protein